MKKQNTTQLDLEQWITEKTAQLDLEQWIAAREPGELIDRSHMFKTLHAITHMTEKFTHLARIARHNDNTPGLEATEHCLRLCSQARAIALTRRSFELAQKFDELKAAHAGMREYFKPTKKPAPQRDLVLLRGGEVPF